MDFEEIIRNVTELSLGAILTGQTAARDDPERLWQELDWVQQKKEAVMDAYFSREISKEDMQNMTGKYEQQISSLRHRLENAINRKNREQDSTALRTIIQADIASIIQGEIESEVFYKTLLQSLTVFRDHHIELRMNWLPQVFHFSG